MRALIYPHCARCECPLVCFLDEKRQRTLCIRCHAELVAKSQRNPHACCCGDTERCKTCRQREYKYTSTQRNKHRAADYFRDYYYRNWEAMCLKTRTWRRAQRARKKAQREAGNAL